MTLKTKNPNSRPKLDKELEKAAEEFDKFDQSVKDLTMDRMNEAPKVELENQTKIANRDLDKAQDIYLKPIKRISSVEAFNEKYRSKLDFDKEYVHFIAENKEIVGELIEMWTKPYPGMPAEFWKIPVNKPVWAPRYVAEQIKRKFYHRLETKEEEITSHDGRATYTGKMVVDTTIPRLDAFPVSKKRSIFMGANDFS